MTVTVGVSTFPVLIDREALAQRVADALTQAFSKIAAHKAEIEQLWIQFENLPKGETIMGCCTKGEFCQKILNRTTRSIQYLLNGRPEPKSNLGNANIVRTTDASAASATPLRFEICSRTDPRYEEIRDRHYIDNKGCIGLQVHFLIWYQGTIAGIISGASAAHSTAPRDKFFGITKDNRKAIDGIVSNVVFRLEIDEPNLATQCLKHFRDIIPHIFYEIYGVVVFGFETFVVENETRVGTIYKADNWTFAGTTAGSTKVRNGIENPAERTDCRPKLVFCKWREGFNAPCTTRTPQWVKEYAGLVLSSTACFPHASGVSNRPLRSNLLAVQ